MGNLEYKINFDIPQEKLNIKSRTIDCACCQEKLVETVEILDIPKKMDYIFTCPYCNGKSFKNKFEFMVKFIPIKCNINEIDYNEGENLCLVKLS